MNDATLSEPQTNGHYPPRAGVRTYRGRRLEDLIPQIRTELGPEAIIVRERQGITGGVGGFFAQRCVEVDARPGHTIDVYDDQPQAGPADADPSFAERLLDAEAVPPMPGRGAAVTPSPYAFAAAPDRTRAAKVTAEETLLSAARRAADEDLRAQEAERQALEEHRAHADSELRAAEAQRAAAQAELAAAEEERLATESARAVAERAAAAATEALAGLEGRLAGLSAEPPPALSPRPRRRAGGLISAAVVRARELSAPVSAASAGPPAPVPDAAPPGGPAVAERLEAQLAASGLSAERARELVAVTLDRGVAPGQAALRAALRAQLSAELATGALTPVAGCATAVTGAPGAGKTELVAGLARSWADRGIAVTVVALDGAANTVALRGRLPRGVRVINGERPRPLLRALRRARIRGPILIDTPGVAAGDITAASALRAKLALLGVDGVVLALPAPLAASAARRVIATHTALGAGAMILTHASAGEPGGGALEPALDAELPVAGMLEAEGPRLRFSEPTAAELANHLLPGGDGPASAAGGDSRVSAR